MTSPFPEARDIAIKTIVSAAVLRNDGLRQKAMTSDQYRLAVDFLRLHDRYFECTENYAQLAAEKARP